MPILAILVLACAAASSLAAPMPFGVGSSAEASGRYREWMPKMASAGVKWVRVFPSWEAIEPSPNTWNWSLMDSMLTTAASNHLIVSGLFVYTPKWLSANTRRFPTNNLAAWTMYVSNVVRHAQGRVRYWEVWNEPENFTPEGTPADYAQMVASAWTAAKAADPAAQIGLSVASVDIVYLERAIQAGAADHFDYICVHPYEVLGTVGSGQEPLFMSVVPTLRKMLRARNPAKADVPIWFTEIGAALGKQTTPVRQAEDLIKAYTMGIAQQVAVIQWFEAQESWYKMGLLDGHGEPTPAYSALKNLATQLGDSPVCKGWVLLYDRDFGFVFQGATGTVLVAWAPPGVVDQVAFGETVECMEPIGGNRRSAETCVLSSAPLFIIGAPSSVVSRAVSNRNRPFPWGGDYSGATEVSLALGGTNIERGLHMLNANAASTAAIVNGGPARDCSKGSGVTFTVDPSFLSYTRQPIRIKAIVRRVSADDNPGFNLKYESASGRKGIGWNSVPAGEQWHTLTWTISDDEFVGTWGYHFSFDSDSTKYSRYYLRQVSVTKLAP